jgi:hypothetical protein
VRFGVGESRGGCGVRQVGAASNGDRIVRHKKENMSL